MGAGWAEAPGHQKTNRDTPGRAEAPERQTHKTSHNNQKKEEHHRVSGSPGGRKDKHQPRPPKGTETPRSPRASNKNKHQPQPEKERQTESNTNHEQKPQRGHRTHANRSHQEEEKAEAPQRRKTSANTPTEGKKTNTAGRAEAPERPGAPKDKNTPGGRSLGAPQDKHQQQRPASKDHSQRIHHEEEKHNGLLHQGGRGDGVCRWGTNP